LAPESILEVYRQLKAAGFESYLVGGCVRDIELGRTPKDYDLATSARPEQVQKLFKKVIPTGIEHGTVTVLVKGGHVEVTTYRSEGKYLDGRRPESVEFHTDIEADLSRRDFTINAMALDPETKKLVDPFGGMADIKARLVRCVRDPMERFGEDGLRALRAVRFATTLDFALDAATEKAIGPTLAVFRKIAKERIRDELQKLIASPHAERGLELLKRTGLLDEVLPGVKLDAKSVARAPVDLRFAVLLLEAPKDVERLKLPNAEMQRILHVAKHAALPDVPDDAALRRWLAKVGRDGAHDVLAVAKARGADVAQLEQRVDAQKNAPLSIKDLAIDGAGIMQTLGVEPGRVVGDASRWLLERVLDDPSRNTPQELRALLKTFSP
jgi:tRNA nucleotidyltransferase (CCA-adding enzyme)